MLLPSCFCSSMTLCKESLILKSMRLWLYAVLGPNAVAFNFFSSSKKGLIGAELNF